MRLTSIHVLSMWDGWLSRVERGRRLPSDSLSRHRHRRERLKAPNRFGLGVERFKHRDKPRNGQEVMIPRGDVQQLQRPTRLPDRSVGSHQLAKATAVDVRHVLEIEDDLGTLLREETVNLVFEMLRAPIHDQ